MKHKIKNRHEPDPYRTTYRLIQYKDKIFHITLSEYNAVNEATGKQLLQYLTHPETRIRLFAEKKLQENSR